MRPRTAVSLIVFAELLGTSLWFTANGVAPQLAVARGLEISDLGALTIAVQLGFIVGTLLFAVSGLADRFRASRIFFVACIVGAAANALFACCGDVFTVALAWRFVTGFALAGIYPLGMKLVTGWAPERRGEVLGWLVGMLVLGTALPHLMQAAPLPLEWRELVLLASLLAVLGGVIVLIAGDGAQSSKATPFRWTTISSALRLPGFRAAAFGYFGHMWELYALWTVVPLLIVSLLANDGLHYGATVSAAAFAFIALGAVGCIAGGRLSRRFGSARVAFVALAWSGLSCIVFPFLVDLLPLFLLAVLLMLWGIAVVADSPQFSALIAASAPPGTVGSALAFVNGIGFAITVIAIFLTASLWPLIGVKTLWLLAPGPLIGLVLMRRLFIDRP